MASNLTNQVRNIGPGDDRGRPRRPEPEDHGRRQGRDVALAETINDMTDTLALFAEQVTGVAREVGHGGASSAARPRCRGGRHLEGPHRQRELHGVEPDQSGAQHRAGDHGGRQGDLTQKITVDAKGELAALAETINCMTDTLRAFAEQVTAWPARSGSQGRSGGQADVPGVAGTWKDLTDSVNSMASSLTSQVRDIAQVTTAVAQGDLSQKITVDVEGEMLELKKTINTMVDQLSSFADEVARVAREVGTEGQLGGQADVPGVAGVWRGLTENVNGMASNLTGQVRNIARWPPRWPGAT
jgi:HAMP domain-containing protein